MFCRNEIRRKQTGKGRRAHQLADVLTKTNGQHSESNLDQNKTKSNRMFLAVRIHFLSLDMEQQFILLGEGS